MFAYLHLATSFESKDQNDNYRNAAYTDTDTDIKYIWTDISVFTYNTNNTIHLYCRAE